MPTIEAWGLVIEKLHDEQLIRWPTQVANAHCVASASSCLQNIYANFR